MSPLTDQEWLRIDRQARRLRSRVFRVSMRRLGRSLVCLLSGNGRERHETACYSFRVPTGEGESAR
jgi:hypothetical protein